MRRDANSFYSGLMKSKTFRLPFEMSKIQIGCFTDQFFCFKSWMKLRIQKPFFFHSTRALTFVFKEKNKNFKRKKAFVSSEKKTCIFSWFSRIKEKHISSLSFLERRKNTYYLSLVSQGVFSHRKIRLKKKTHFLFLF